MYFFDRKLLMYTFKMIICVFKKIHIHDNFYSITIQYWFFNFNVIFFLYHIALQSSVSDWRDMSLTK